MKKVMQTVLLSLSLLVLSGQGGAADIDAAIADSTRPDGASDRDAARNPAAVLELSGVDEDDKIIEITPGGGYYTALLSRIVGDEGHIYAVDPERIFEHFPNMRQAFPGYLEQDPRENVTHSVQMLDALSVDEQVDQVWMILYYHDTVWTGVDRAKMNQAIFDALKPGGVYMIADHYGADGGGEAITKDLHRIEASLVQTEVEAAGFELDAKSSALSHPDDPRDDSVFAPDRRGMTDRFVWRYVKAK